MSANQLVYNDWRVIPDAFMANGESGYDGREGIWGFIDCTLKLSGGKVKNICRGISAKSTGDASGYAQIKIKGRDGSAIVTLSLALGIVHPLDLSRLYPSDAQGVVLHY